MTALGHGDVDTRQRWILEWWPVLVLMLAGSALRLYRLGDQSVWMDEFMNVACLGASSGRESLRLIGLYFPEHERCPLYYLLNYYWAQMVGHGLYGLRMLPVMLGVATIPLLYLFVRGLFGARVALVAALCYALSPQHIWHAQEIRPYCLVMPLVLVALYSLLQGLRGGGRAWWGINVAAGTLLVWTHALCAVFVFTEGIFLLFYMRKNFHSVVLWGVAQALALTPWALWLLTMPYMYEIRGDTDFATVINDMLFDEMVSHHTDLLPPYKSNPVESLRETARILVPWQPYFDGAMTVVILGALVALAVALLHGLMRRTEMDVNIRLQNAVLVTVLLVVPNLVLGALCKMFEAQVIGPMYALYNTLGLYVAVGLLFSRGAGRAYGVSLVVLALLYGYQLALVLPETTRSNWVGIARHIERHATPRDTVFDIQSYGPSSFLPYNWPEREIPIERVWTLEAAVQDSAAYLASVERPSGEPEPSAWIVYEEFMLNFRWWDSASILEGTLRELGLNTERQRFAGHYDTGLIRVTGVPSRLPATPVPEDDAGVDYSAVLAELHLETGNAETDGERLKALRRNVSYWPPLILFVTTFQADWALAEGHLDVARALQEWVLKQRPEFGLAHFGYGLVRASQRQPEAQEDFETAYVLHPGLEQLFGNYVFSLLHQQDCDACLSEVDQLEAKGYIAFADAMRAACRYRAGLTLPSI